MNCGKCSYWKQGEPSTQADARFGSRARGECFVEPKPVNRSANERACRHFLQEEEPWWRRIPREEVEDHV